MSTILTYVRLTGLIIGFALVQTLVLGQGNSQLLFAGLHGGVSIVPGSVIGPVAGIDVQYQYPMGSNFVLTARSGLEAFAIRSEYKPDYQYYFGTTTGLSLPVLVGGRYYVYGGLYIALNAGVEISRSRLAASGLRYESAFGYAIPLPNGDYIDAGTSFITNLKPGNGFFAINLAYGFDLSR